MNTHPSARRIPVPMADNSALARVYENPELATHKISFCIFVHFRRPSQVHGASGSRAPAKRLPTIQRGPTLPTRPASSACDRPADSREQVIPFVPIRYSPLATIPHPLATADFPSILRPPLATPWKFVTLDPGCPAWSVQWRHDGPDEGTVGRITTMNVDPDNLIPARALDQMSYCPRRPAAPNARLTRPSRGAGPGRT